jgi:hypothetical protein
MGGSSGTRKGSAERDPMLSDTYQSEAVQKVEALSTG